MREISVEESFELFLATLHRLDEENLSLADSDLLYIIFENLDIESNSFLHFKTVDRLVKNNLIPASISLPVLELREKLIDLIKNKGAIDKIRNDIEWAQARMLANKILLEIE